MRSANSSPARPSRSSTCLCEKDVSQSATARPAMRGPDRTPNRPQTHSEDPIVLRRWPAFWECQLGDPLAWWLARSPDVGPCRWQSAIMSKPPGEAIVTRSLATVRAFLLSAISQHRSRAGLHARVASVATLAPAKCGPSRTASSIARGRERVAGDHWLLAHNMYCNLCCRLPTHPALRYVLSSQMESWREYNAP